MSINNFNIIKPAFVSSAFTPAFRPRHGNYVTDLNKLIKFSNLTTLKRSLNHITSIRACKEIANESNFTTTLDDDDDETEDIHESWRVYSKPGNLCVICGSEGRTKCLYCFGEGTVRVGPENERDTLICPHCDGAATEICPRCEGTGIRPSTRELPTGEIVRNPTNEEICRGVVKENGVSNVENGISKEETKLEAETRA